MKTLPIILLMLSPFSYAREIDNILTFSENIGVSIGQTINNAAPCGPKYKLVTKETNPYPAFQGDTYFRCTAKSSSEMAKSLSVTTNGSTITALHLKGNETADGNFEDSLAGSHDQLELRYPVLKGALRDNAGSSGDEVGYYWKSKNLVYELPVFISSNGIPKKNIQFVRLDVYSCSDSMMKISVKSKVDNNYKKLCQ